MPRKRARYLCAADVQCPFYLSESPEQICINCEGFTAGSTMQLRFKSRRGKEAFMRERCNESYKGCTIYRGLMRDKYGEG